MKMKKKKVIFDETLKYSLENLLPLYKRNQESIEENAHFINRWLKVEVKKETKK